MRYYETIYIVHPDFEDSRLDEIMSSVDKQIEKNCDEIVNSYVWGKRRSVSYTHLTLPTKRIV